MIKALFTMALAIFSFGLFAQSAKTIVYQNQEYTISGNISELKAWLSDHQGQPFWIHFSELPNETERMQIQASGIDLQSYIQGKSYLASAKTEGSWQVHPKMFGFTELGLKERMSERLFIEDINPEAFVDGKVRVEMYGVASSEHKDLHAFAKRHCVDLEQPSTENPHYFTMDMKVKTIKKLDKIKSIYRFEAWSGPGVKDDTEGRSLHRSSSIDTRMNNGRNYDGTGIGVMVRDDGIVGPHIDFEGRVDNTTAFNQGQTHGDGVAGIMAGSGNLDPQKRGMAAGSDIYVTNYNQSFLDAATTNRISNGSVQITNSSYSNGCNAGYTGVTVTVDNQSLQYPNLLHVFSAGNSNNQDCGYGAGSQWGNITGGHKQGKNVIATANVFYQGGIVSSSSRGPAHDGRIKPDIAANGQNQLSTDEYNNYMSFGGTSGAAPGIAGIAAQLYQAYGEFNNGDLPENALIKATLLNTANDYGNVGPDFTFGWGIVNSLKAARLIEEGRYLNSTISTGETNNHTIVVPPNCKEVRFMLYWNEIAATSGSNVALVNDLDLTVTDPSLANKLPWLLDHAPNTASLSSPATNGADHLNNVEQVLIKDPATGAYTINVDGFNIPFGPQKYWIVYDFVLEEVEVIYPNLGEPLIAGTVQTIHWDRANNGSALIEFSADNGVSWSTVSNTSATSTNQNWSVPNVVTGNAKVRVTINGETDESDSTFSIGPVVSGIEVVSVCPDSTLIQWTNVPQAEEYDVYVLGNKYMEIVGTTTNPTSMKIENATPNDPFYYAVRARSSSLNWTSERSIAQYYEGGLLNCVYFNDMAVSKVVSTADNFSGLCNPADGIVTIEIENAGQLIQGNFDVQYQVDGGTAVVETFSGNLNPSEKANHTFATPVATLADGSHTITASVLLGGDDYNVNDMTQFNFIKQSNGLTTPYLQNFQITPFVEWTNENLDQEIGWAQRAVVGPTGTITQVMWVDHREYTSVPQQDAIISPVYNLPASNSTLTFDLAKANFGSGFFDTLIIEISTDCGATYTSIYNKGAFNLQTVSYKSDQWTPTSASNWKNETIDLTTYNGQKAQFKVIAKNGNGNSTFIDNFNVKSTLGITTDHLETVNIFPNPTSDKVWIEAPNSKSDVQVEVLDLTGRQMSLNTIQKGQDSFELNMESYVSGLYMIILTSENNKKVFKVEKN
jgi:hypothetical protein